MFLKQLDLRRWIYFMQKFSGKIDTLIDIFTSLVETFGNLERVSHVALLKQGITKIVENVVLVRRGSILVRQAPKCLRHPVDRMIRVVLDVQRDAAKVEAIVCR